MFPHDEHQTEPEKLKQMKIYREYSLSRSEKIIDWDIHPEEEQVLILDRRYLYQYSPKKHE
jgi:hypothetical protein